MKMPNCGGGVTISGRRSTLGLQSASAWRGGALISDCSDRLKRR